jgi:prolyl-tRNA synthetase
VHLTVLRGSDSPAGEVAERVYASLEEAGIGVLFDDRGERPGVQFADADLIGLPLRLTVSERSLNNGGIELKRRTGDESRIVAEEALVLEVRAELDAAG